MTIIQPIKTLSAVEVQPGAALVHHDQRWVLDEKSQTLTGTVLWLVPADGRTKRRTRLEVDADTQLHLEGDRQVQLQALKSIGSGNAEVLRLGTESVTLGFDGGWEFELTAAPIVTAEATEGESIDEDDDDADR